MANYPDDEEYEAIHDEAPDKNRDAHVYDYDGYQPADSLVGASSEKGHQGQNAEDVFLPIGQGSAENGF
jgi:hypothetical protein